ncbi:protein EXORDIUM-like [Quillaja saponaria]|uniref:Protein EXORDIUM-like n=1 Tax=Quillaja saponaria TaxID=32244 RepID=A0AAD7PKH8_QUISA|nr:protein EXORDIUM-like [Quillaja saponaria]
MHQNHLYIYTLIIIHHFKLHQPPKTLSKPLLSFSIKLMASTYCQSAKILVLLHLISLISSCLEARKLASLYQTPPVVLTYHNGKLLEGDIPVSILWYGEFSPSQKSTIADFLLSLTYYQKGDSSKIPTVSNWWKTIQIYMKKAGKKETRVYLSNQVSDKNYSLGKLLKKPQISELALKAYKTSKPNELAIVLTAKDVAVEGFCMSNCGLHGSISKFNSAAFIWVGNSVTQCPGQCAWPFHQPTYGPQTPPLVAPNGDVGVDGMIVNIATLLAGAVTNPYGNGYFLGSANAPLEAASACPGVYVSGAYSGYAGKLLVDSETGASYNAIGLNGRKHLLPALFDPLTFQCSTLV